MNVRIRATLLAIAVAIGGSGCTTYDDSIDRRFMSAPTQIVTWDSTQANIVPTTSGHQSSGWGLSEVPTSTEMNGWMYAVAVWIAYLVSLVRPAQWEWLPVPNYSGSGPVWTGSMSFVTAGSNITANLSTSSTVAIPIFPEVGESITAVGFMSTALPNAVVVGLTGFDPSTGLWVTTSGVPGSVFNGGGCYKAEFTFVTPFTVTDDVTQPLIGPYFVTVTTSTHAIDLIGVGYQSQFGSP